MQVVQFNISLRDAQEANEILNNLRYLKDERLKQTSTNTYEIADVDDDPETECSNWDLYSQIYESFEKRNIDFHIETLEV